jgi:methanogenic corrinoid protein MtbC1
MAQAAERARESLEHDQEEPGDIEESTAAAVDLDDPFVPIRKQMVDAVRRFDPASLERLLSSVSYTGRVSMIYDRVLAPVMYEIGELWHEGEISVGQEHMASYLLEGTARNMLNMLEFAEDATPVILACTEDEEHSFPVFGLAFRLARWGYHPTMLGPRTPPAGLQAAIKALKPEWVGMSMTVEPPKHVVREMVEAYVRVAGSVPVLFGGVGTQSLREQIENLGGIVPANGTEAALRVAIDVAKKQRGRR